MNASEVFTLLFVSAVGVMAIALAVSFLRARRVANRSRATHETVEPRFMRSDPSIRSPAGSIAERRRVIEDVLRGKETPQN